MPVDYSAEVRRLAALLRRPDPMTSELVARIERIDAGILIANDQGDYVAANQRAADITGYTREELTRLTLGDITPVPYGGDARKLWREFLRVGDQRGTFALRRKDGVTVTVTYAAWAHIAPDRHVTVLTLDR